MRTGRLIALLLIVVGLIALAYQGITYTTREKVIDLGPVEVTAEETKTIPLRPVVGALALACGIVLLLIDRKRP
jgi:hypothetical protein